MLEWARTSIGLSSVAASRRIGVPDERVDEWEAGDKQPTIAQLRKAAVVYKRSLGALFLSSPPADFDTMRDFRQQGDEEADWSTQLHGEYRRAHFQRDCLLELAEIEDEPLSEDWQIEGLPSSEEEIGAVARAALERIAPIQIPQVSATPYEHLNAWTAALEEAGIMVLATQRGGVSTTEMRAFSLYFDTMPVIVANGSDAVRGRLFSLLHEYAHLLLHTAGLCDITTDSRSLTGNRRLEARCNAIAAATLMPRDRVLQSSQVVQRRDAPESWDYPALSAAAAPFGVSAEAFLRRLVELGQSTIDFYQIKRSEFLEAYEQEGLQRLSGGNWYRSAARDLGKAYVRRVSDAYKRRVIDSYTAASFLNVKVGQIPRLAEAASIPAAS